MCYRRVYFIKRGVCATGRNEKIIIYSEGGVGGWEDEIELPLPPGGVSHGRRATRVALWEDVAGV
jgi:hypothetical protein